MTANVLQSKLIRMVILTVVFSLMLFLAVATLHAQTILPCTHPLHPNGDLVPCSHFVPTPCGIRPIHNADVVPCGHPLHPYGDVY